MTNCVLFNSSIFHAVIIIVIMAIYIDNIPLHVISLICIVLFTSIWNHGTRNPMAKLLDMCACIFTSGAIMYYALTIPIYLCVEMCIGIIFAGFLVPLSKFSSSKWKTCMHIAAHFIAALCVVWFIIAKKPKL